ncbi:TPA: thiamine diphosphokinase [Streptococcus suis]
MATYYLCGGGPNPQLTSFLPTEADIVIGVDRGALTLIQAGFPLDVALGDFDSVTPQEKALILSKAKMSQVYPPEKDLTDFQIALEWIKNQNQALDQIWITGFYGAGRLDHFLSNMWLAHHPSYKDLLPHFKVLEEGMALSFYQAGSHQLTPDSSYHYLSIITFEANMTLGIEGAKYNLQPTLFHQPQAFISNEFMGSNIVKLTLDQGLVAVILQARDRPGL